MIRLAVFLSLLPLTARAGVITAVYLPVNSVPILIPSQSVNPVSAYSVPSLPSFSLPSAVSFVGAAPVSAAVSPASPVASFGAARALAVAAALRAPASVPGGMAPFSAAFFDGARPSGDVPAPVPNPAVDAFIRELVLVLVKSGGDPTKVEAELIGVLARAHAAGQLRAVIEGVMSDPRLTPHLPPIPAEKRPLFAAQLSMMIGAELEGAGAVPGAKPFEPWDAMAARQTALIKASAFPSRGQGQDSLFAEPGFVKEYEALTGAAFTDGNRARPLIDGPESFKARFALMRRAKTSIHIQSWAFYDDATGEATADLLIAKKAAGVEVKIMVDGKTTAQHGAAVLARLEAAGVEVVRFQDASRPYDGLHTKVMIVDGRWAIAGGMNFGNDYSHMGGGQKWRDTDLFYSGPAVAESSAFMARLWNAQAKAQGLAHGAMEPASAHAVGGGKKLAFLHDSPEGDATILLAHMKAIAGASREINIENAYLIEMPQLKAAILEALARGVKVNILTNSAESVDEPIVTAPILASLPELVAAGAKVYLKRGDTLHSKFMTVDGLFAIVGSFNLHPRSVRYEHEMIVAGLDAGLAAALNRAFATDLAAALPITDPAQIAMPDSALNRLVRRYLYNQL